MKVDAFLNFNEFQIKISSNRLLKLRLQQLNWAAKAKKTSLSWYEKQYSQNTDKEIEQEAKHFYDFVL